VRCGRAAFPFKRSAACLHSSPSSPLPMRSGFYECGSSICQAAIHAGVLTDDGGTFWLNNEEGQVEYVGEQC